ncbi:MAG: hypothetical protein PWQ06_2396 [Anaerophaga sp.]|nr:hypothetical protein [Anaerophaga sp.]
MQDVKGFPPTAQETLDMLSDFTGSYAVLTVDTGNDFSFIRAFPPNIDKPETEEVLSDILHALNDFGKNISGWQELSDRKYIQPFSSGRFINLSVASLSGTCRLCLFCNEDNYWDRRQLLLMDQTRQIIEQQFENYFFEKKDGESADNEKFRLLFDFFPVGIFFYNTSLEITAFNERFASILSVPSAKLLNFDLTNVVDSSVLPAIKAPLSGEEGLYEGPYTYTINGKTVNLRLKTAPILNASNNITGIMGVVQDNTERIQTLHDLNESKDRLRVLINATPDIICFKDAKGRWMEANESIQELFRLKGKNFLFKSEEHLKKMVPELAEVFEKCRESDMQAWEKREPVTVEETVPLLNGDERKFDVIKTPVFDEHGNRKGLVILGRDITARKKAEEMLRESEERFRIVATHANDIIFEWDPKTDKMSWFGKAGYIGNAKVPPQSFDDFIGLVHTEDRERISRFWKNRFFLKEEWKDEFRIDSAGGKVKYYRGSGIMIFKEGKPDKAIGTFTDVTQEKELINSLRDAVEVAQHNQARITGLLSVIPDIIFIFDREGVIKDYHAESINSLYASPDVFLDQPVDEVLPSEVARLTREKINEVARHKGIETYEYELSNKGICEVYESRMVYVDDNRFMTIVRDVTHARQVEKELIEAKEQAEKSDRLKSAFLANMSHEIRTPMNGIIGFSELLRNNDLSDNERQNCIDVIVKSGQQLLSIINDVLEISQLETGQITVLPNRVNLNRLMNDLARFFMMEANEKSVELKCLLPDEDYFLFVDGGKITQIFNNLISNAFKYTPPGGQIVFGFEPLADNVRFFVKDNGIGIDPQHHKLIFERFGQVVKAGAKNKGGTGLGLSICKSLVELMGGKIWVESEPGHGSNFFFMLPVKDKKG